MLGSFMREKRTLNATFVDPNLGGKMVWKYMLGPFMRAKRTLNATFVDPNLGKKLV